MIRRTWVYIVVAVGVCVGATALLDAQKGGKPKPSSDLPGTALLSCPAPGTCGILGDGQAIPARLLTSTGEMNFALAEPHSITLDFQGQNPDNSAPADCSLLEGSCLWNWTAFPQMRTFTSDFVMQSNSLDPSGETELAGGLLGMVADNETAYRARLNMTITVEETSPSWWRFDFNPNIPPDGGGIPVKVVRNDSCTWTFSAVEGETAALSILVKPPKGKQYVHREGRYTMPFVLTFNVPNCVP